VKSRRAEEACFAAEEQPNQSVSTKPSPGSRTVRRASGDKAAEMRTQRVGSRGGGVCFAEGWRSIEEDYGLWAKKDVLDADRTRMLCYTLELPTSAKSS
jgi:hypothetical protein